MKREMINIGLPRYGTRMLQAGDRFEANRRDARVLHALKKARYVTEKDVGTALGSALIDERAALRAEYQEKLGKKAFPGWSAEQLRENIAAGGTGEG